MCPKTALEVNWGVSFRRKGVFYSHLESRKFQRALSADGVWRRYPDVESGVKAKPTQREETSQWSREVIFPGRKP